MPFSIERNDLATMQVDAVVVAANEQLQITGGVGGAVANAAGFSDLQTACDAIGGCPTGQAVVTPGFALPASHIVHAVGPVWDHNVLGKRDILLQTYQNALLCAHEVGAYSIGLPLLSAGSYGCPSEISFAVAMQAIRAFLDEYEAEVHLVLFSRAAVIAGMAMYGEIAEYVDDHYVDEAYAERREQFGRERDRGVHHTYVPHHFGFGAGVPDFDGASAPSAGYVGSAPAYAPSAPAAGPAPAAKQAGPAPLHAPAPEQAAKQAGPAPTAKQAGRGREESVPRPSLFERIRDTFAPREKTAAKEYQVEEAEFDFELEAARCEEPELAAARYEEAEFGFEPEAMVCEAAEVVDDIDATYTYHQMAAPSSTQDLRRLLDRLDAPFSTTLLALIDARGLKDAEVYKRANMSRQLFSKIRSEEMYQPSKRTVLALAVALHLDLDETDDLLRRAGFALSDSSKSDVIVSYFIGRGNYDIYSINEALYAFDQPIL